MDNYSSNTNKTILIVDDNADLRFLLSKMLDKYDTCEAENGQQAIQMFKERNPDLVLMDIKMPVMNGIQATREIKKINPDALIIGISAYSSFYGKDLLNESARALLSKPVRKTVLLELVAKYLEVVRGN